MQETRDWLDTDDAKDNVPGAGQRPVTPDNQAGIPWGVPKAGASWGSPEQQQPEHWEDEDEDDILGDPSDFIVVARKKKKKKGKVDDAPGNAGKGRGRGRI